MNTMSLALRGRLILAVFCLLLAGCSTTPKIDWASRVGNYTYDQAVMDYGPPDKEAKLENGSRVSEWLTQRGYSYVSGGGGSYYYGYHYRQFGAPYPLYTQTTPDYYLRLVFGRDNKLLSARNFAK
jgi:hypothetical protein